MFDNIVTKEVKWGGSTLKLETGKIARQASAAVVVSMGGTVVLCTVVGQKEAKPDANFFPLTVHYQEGFYAAGRFPGGFIKRESKPSEREVLTSRLIDRPIRPLFPEGYFNEVQVISKTLSYDGQNDPDILGLIGASAALTISNIPFAEAVGAARVGYKDGKFILNPVQSDRESLDLVIAGTATSVLMVESSAKELPEDVMLEAIMFGHESFQDIIKVVNELAADVGNTKQEFNTSAHAKLEKDITSFAEKDIEKAYSEPAKQIRSQNVNEVKQSVISKFSSETLSSASVEKLFDLVCAKIVREQILKKEKRIDGRKSDQIRNISCELDLLPMTHGSALFTRGETQSISVVTLGTTQDEQIVDDLMGNTSERFMLHYNFPPYSVGETSMLKAPGRREIGHGKLAARAISAVLPKAEAFPYTIRVMSEITESNGSSSMATVCGASLALMAAAVPISKPVSGIAMGLIKKGEKFVILSDIMGDEDHLGDMDFKVAGTENGITALQMDIKINGISRDIMEAALIQAKAGRAHILAEMQKVIEVSRKELSDHAPRIVSIKIDKDKIRDVIGSGGKMIREICETSGAKVDIEDDGRINISCSSKTSIDTAIKMIQDIVSEPEVGMIYDGTVVKLTNFGAFVRFLGNTEGLLHISEISDTHIDDINDVLSENQKIKVKVVGFERGGKIRLTAKNFDEERPQSDDSRGGKRGGGGGYKGSKPSYGRSDSGYSDRPRDSRREQGGGGEDRRRGFKDDRGERRDSRRGAGGGRSGTGDRRREEGQGQDRGDRSAHSGNSNGNKQRRFF